MNSERRYRDCQRLDEQPDQKAQERIVSQCADCGRDMTKAEGGTIFTVCEQCWDLHFNHAASQHAMQGLQEERDRLQAEVEQLQKLVQDLRCHAHAELGKIMDQRAAMQGLAEALRALLKMVREDESSPVMHNENCSAWCHYRPLLQQADAALSSAAPFLEDK